MSASFVVVLIIPLGLVHLYYCLYVLLYKILFYYCMYQFVGENFFSKIYKYTTITWVKKCHLYIDLIPISEGVKLILKQHTVINVN